jgi:hypothetical protein
MLADVMAGYCKHPAGFQLAGLRFRLVCSHVLSGGMCLPVNRFGEEFTQHGDKFLAGKTALEQGVQYAALVIE